MSSKFAIRHGSRWATSSSRMYQLSLMTMSTRMFLACLGFISVQSFVSNRYQFGATSHRVLRHEDSRLASSRDGNDGMEEMRKLLEASWNTDTMGKVPSTPEAAAEEAATSLQGAINKGQSLFFVDILLPSYDITQGENMYDEVLAVEFCIALAGALEDQTAIYVRDEKRLFTVNRILEARERDRELESAGYGDDDEDDEDGTNLEEQDMGSASSTTVEFYDDFADFGDDVGRQSEAEPLSKDEMDTFREQLAASWDSPAAEKSSADPVRRDRSRTPSEPKQSNRIYRLASMFGSSDISRGSDMVDKVLGALKENAIPHEKEDTLIILSAITPEELLAVRSLVGSYKSSKTIILVNCKLDPVPRELMGAETVYSILPLIAKPKTNDRNLFQKEEQDWDDQAPPKIVVLRRFPTDWEVYVDSSGSGFELAGTTPATQTAKKGPPMEWVAGCVKRHLESKLG